MLNSRKIDTLYVIAWTSSSLLQLPAVLAAVAVAENEAVQNLGKYRLEHLFPSPAAYRAALLPDVPAVDAVAWERTAWFHAHPIQDYMLEELLELHPHMQGNQVWLCALRRLDVLGKTSCALGLIPWAPSQPMIGKLGSPVPPPSEWRGGGR